MGGEENIMENYIQVQITFPTEGSAAAMAELLLERRLVACVQILGPIRSVYVWKGVREESVEILLLAKTKASLFDALAETVRADHPYECPQIVAVPIVNGTPDYLRWVDENTVSAVIPTQAGT